MLIKVHRYPVVYPTLLENFLNTSVHSFTHHHPAIDLAEYENESVIVVEMPGVNKEDLKVSVLDDTVTISGVRKEDTVPESSNWIRNEIRSGHFSRTVRLPHEVKADAISAELTNGVLRIVLPKAEDARPRDIRVQ